MARPSDLVTNLRPIIENFAAQLVDIVQRQSDDRARNAVLQSLGAANGSVPPRRGPGRPPGSKNVTAAAAPARHISPATPAQAKARKLQGQYMGGLRALNKTDKAKAKATFEKDGVEAAIALIGKIKAAASKAPAAKAAKTKVTAKAPAKKVAKTAAKRPVSNIKGAKAKSAAAHARR